MPEKSRDNDPVSVTSQKRISNKNRFVLLTFDFIARREESIEERIRGLTSPGLPRLNFFVFFVFFVVQILLVIGLPEKPAPGPSWWSGLIRPALKGAESTPSRH